MSGSTTCSDITTAQRPIASSLAVYRPSPDDSAKDRLWLTFLRRLIARLNRHDDGGRRHASSNPRCPSGTSNAPTTPGGHNPSSNPATPPSRPNLTVLDLTECVSLPRM